MGLCNTKPLSRQLFSYLFLPLFLSAIFSYFSNYFFSKKTKKQTNEKFVYCALENSSGINISVFLVGNF